LYSTKKIEMISQKQLLLKYYVWYWRYPECNTMV